MENTARVYDTPIQVKLDSGYKKLKLDPLQGILNFVYKEMQNPSIVDTEGFKEMIMQVKIHYINLLSKVPFNERVFTKLKTHQLVK
jgi:hypothetical protein